jgi:signal transduction histidine kinase
VSRMVGGSRTEAGSWIELRRGLAGAGHARGWTPVRIARPRIARRSGPATGAAQRTAATGRRLIVACTSGAAAMTIAVSVLPFLRFAYRSPLAHASIDTAATVISAIAALLLLLRFRRTGAVRDLFLFAALATLAMANLTLSVVPDLAAAGQSPLSTWALLAARLVGVTLLAAVWLTGGATLRAPKRAAWWTLAGAAGVIASIALLAVVLEPSLPEAVEPSMAAVDRSRPHLVGHPLVLGGQLVGMLLFAAAGIGFARRAAGEGDQFMAWLGAGAVMGAFARLNYFLCPSLFTDFVYTGDAFNLAFYALVLVGAAGEIAAYHRGIAAIAVLEERRRIARNMHDGLAQELAFIAVRVRRLQADAGPSPELDQLMSAAERALEDSRAAISALTRPVDEPLDVAIARNASEVATRLGAQAELDAQAGVEVPLATREELVRISREAVANAVRHGSAEDVRLTLSCADTLRLTVTDDGCGFDPGARARTPGSGFGLVSMRERAEALGGTLAVVSAPGAGTMIDVVLPCPSR